MSETPLQRHRRAVIERDGPGCAMDDGRCAGRTQAHHIIPKSRLKVHVPADRLDDALADGRNGCMLCEIHHSAHVYDLTPEQLPDEIEAFAVEYGIEWALAKATKIEARP